MDLGIWIGGLGLCALLFLNLFLLRFYLKHRNQTFVTAPQAKEITDLITDLRTHGYIIARIAPGDVFLRRPR